MLLDGPLSILSPRAFGGEGGSDGKSGVGSTPLVCVWGVCVVLPLSWFLSKSISLVLPRKQWIEPATFRFVAQHLNHCATAVCYICI